MSSLLLELSLVTYLGELQRRNQSCLPLAVVRLSKFDELDLHMRSCCRSLPVVPFPS
jgi:hypothetical protein